MELVIKGLTLRNTTNHCASLFNISINETKRISTFLNQRIFINQSVYLIIDIIDDKKLDRVWGGYPSIGKDPTYVNLDAVFEMVTSSNHYNLIYNNAEIFIFEVIR